MNSSYASIHIREFPQEVNKLSHELTKAFAFLLIPTELLYFSIYFKLKGFYRLYKYLSFLSIATFWISSKVAPVSCGTFRCVQNFAVAIGTMKILDIWARRHSFPAYTSGRRPQDWLLSVIILTEFRYESFTPNHIRLQRNQERFSESFQLGLHIIAFALLQLLPQTFPTVLAFEVLLCIYIIFTSLQMVLRYKSSPPLFGPLYLIDSLSGFWSETWHNVFSSPCASLAYAPLRYGLPKLGLPVKIARSLGILGAFSLMAVFHVYCIQPILSTDASMRIGVFFFLNGVATVVEGAIWGHERHWIKTAAAWGFETVLASWTTNGLDIPNGLSKIPWRNLCST